MHFVKPRRFVDRVFIHCSASNSPRHDDIAIIRAWHLDKSPPWSDVGYHGFIKTDGTFQLGRDQEKQPAGQYPHNKGTLAICCHGLYIDDFTDDQFETLTQYCREVNEAYDGKVTFHGHREVNENKSCPVFDYKKVLNLDEEGHMIMHEQKIRIIETINGMQILAKITQALPTLNGAEGVFPEGKFYNLEDAFVLNEGTIIPLGAGLAMENQIIEIADRNIMFTYVPTADIIEDYQNLLLNTIEAIKATKVGLKKVDV